MRQSSTTQISTTVVFGPSFVSMDPINSPHGKFYTSSENKNVRRTINLDK